VFLKIRCGFSLQEIRRTTIPMLRAIKAEFPYVDAFCERPEHDLPERRPTRPSSGDARNRKLIERQGGIVIPSGK
jgi:hypothetical protein